MLIFLFFVKTIFEEFILNFFFPKTNLNHHQIFMFYKEPHEELIFCESS